MVYGFVLGFLTGLMLDVVWSQKLNVAIDKSRFTHVIEHYHWGLIFFIIDIFIPTEFLLTGLASAFFVSEWTFDKIHPFAYGKAHFISSTIIGAILFIIAIFVWIFYVLLI